MSERAVWLGIDTASDMASVALCDERTVLGESSWRSRRRHTRELAPVVARLLEASELRPGQLAGVAVAIGPGSYTGLRIGLAFAKGLVGLAGQPLIGVPTLHALAAPLLPPHAPPAPPLWALMSAGRGRVIAARYEGSPKDGDWPDPATLPVRRPDDLLALISPGERAAGEIDAELAGLLRAKGVSMVAPPAALRRATWLAWLGRESAAAGKLPDPAELEPVYPGGAP
jgi:tRNA threonylcarbamoyladenosine biosynthesis protein TsaB